MDWTTAILVFIMAASVAMQVYLVRHDRPTARHQLAGTVVTFAFAVLLLPNRVKPQTAEARVIDGISDAILIATIIIFAVAEFILWRRYRQQQSVSASTEDQTQ